MKFKKGTKKIFDTGRNFFEKSSFHLAVTGLVFLGLALPIVRSFEVHLSQRIRAIANFSGSAAPYARVGKFDLNRPHVLLVTIESPSGETKQSFELQSWLRSMVAEKPHWYVIHFTFPWYTATLFKSQEGKYIVASEYCRFLSKNFGPISKFQLKFYFIDSPEVVFQEEVPCATP